MCMQTLEDKIAFLYPDQKEEVYKKLQKIIEEYRIKFASRIKRTGSFFSEKDTVLISYADHVHEENTKTLKSMHSFLTDYVLGSINKIHFLPFFPYTSDDGFSVVDYYKVKKEYGDWTDLINIHKDFLLMYDFVANHVSQKSEWFQKFLNGDEYYTKFFMVYDTEQDTSSVFRPRQHPLLTKFETKKGPKYVWTTFSEDQIDLNPSNPEVVLELIRVLLFYIEHGADTIRLDAVAYLLKQLETTSVHLKETHVIIKLFRQIIDELAPDVWIITETNVPHTFNISYFGSGSDEAHLVYNFALPPLLLHSFINGEAETLSNWAKTLQNPSEKATFFNFTASHDGIGVTALYDFISEEKIENIIEHVKKHGGKINYRSIPGGERPYELNIVYLDAVGGIEQFIASQAIQLSLQGVPAIYFNSLIGDTNWTEGIEKLGYNRAINRRKFNLNDLKKELSDPSSTKHYVYKAYINLLQSRIKEPLFNPHVPQMILTVDPKLFVLKRYDNTTTLLTITNVSNETVPFTKGSEILQKTSGFDILTNRTIDLSNTYNMKPYEVLWIK